MAEQTVITTRLDEGNIESVSEEIIQVETPEVSAISEWVENNNWEFVGVVTETSHEWPHIMGLKADYVPGLPITTTNLTSIVFLWIVALVCFYARWVLTKVGWKFRTWILNFVDVSYQFLTDSFDGDRKYARAYYPLIMWVFVLIFFWNLFWLVIDWFGFVAPSVHYVARPIFSDLASTIPLALLTVWYSLYISVKLHGAWNVTKGYMFNSSGSSIAEKWVNVFVGWLHIIGIPSSIASLALRLFWNIFAGVVLIAVLAYLLTLATEFFGWVWVLATLPFWFFELFVAFVQALVFAMLMIATFKQSHEHH